MFTTSYGIASQLSSHSFEWSDLPHPLDLPPIDLIQAQNDTRSDCGALMSHHVNIEEDQTDGQADPMEL